MSVSNNIIIANACTIGYAYIHVSNNTNSLIYFTDNMSYYVTLM